MAHTHHHHGHAHGPSLGTGTTASYSTAFVVGAVLNTVFIAVEVTYGNPGWNGA